MPLVTQNVLCIVAVCDANESSENTQMWKCILGILVGYQKRILRVPT